MHRLHTIAVCAAIITATTAVYAEQTQQESQPSKAQQSATHFVAKDEIVVVAERLQTPYKETGSSVSSFNETDIENTKIYSLPELLQQVPGLSIATNGNRGSLTSVFIRGAESDHTVVMLDGIELNDPSNPVRSFDFGQFELTNIEQVEILRGPQSTLYGSDAIGGVINLRTKKGSGKPTFYASSEMGSFETFRETGGFSGSTDLFNYSFGISHTYTDGYSAATHTKGNREEDDYQNLTVSTRLGFTPTDNFELFATLRYIDSETEIDEDKYLVGPTDDPNHITNDEKFFLRTQAEWMLVEDVYEQIAGFSYSNYNRNTNDNPDAIDPYIIRGSSDAQWYQFDYQHNLYFPELKLSENFTVNNIFSAGLEYEEEQAETHYMSTSLYGPYESNMADRTANTWGFFVQDKISLSHMFFTTFGVRWDHHSRFGTEATMRVVPTIWIEQTGTKLKAAWGTGFKAPTIDQLYGSSGNVDLNPEESKSWEIGIEQFLFNGSVHAGITYFQNDYDDLITSVLADPVFYIYENRNVERAESSGLEIFCNWEPIDVLALGFSYTYLDTKYLEDTSALDERDVFVRRPHNSFSATANYSFLDNRGHIYAELVYVGSREDYDFSGPSTERVVLDRYLLFNMAASYDVTKNIELFGRLHNIFDDYHEDVYGYDTQRFSLFGGVKISL